MKIKRLIILVPAFILILFSACKKEADAPSTPSDPYDSLCTPTSELYFRGVINGQSKCWNDRVNNYQFYSGGATISLNGEQFKYWTTGLNQYPVPPNAEAVYLNIEKPCQTLDCTTEDFYSAFIPGIYPLVRVTHTGTSGLEVVYETNTGVYYSRSGPQDSCQIQLIDTVHRQEFGTDRIILRYRFNCKLYTCGGGYYGEISMGELRCLLIRPENGKKSVPKF